MPVCSLGWRMYKIIMFDITQVTIRPSKNCFWTMTVNRCVLLNCTTWRTVSSSPSVAGSTQSGETSATVGESPAPSLLLTYWMMWKLGGQVISNTRNVKWIRFEYCVIDKHRSIGKLYYFSRNVEMCFGFVIFIKNLN